MALIEIVAFGAASNDIRMREVAGVRIAMPDEDAAQLMADLEFWLVRQTTPVLVWWRSARQNRET